MAKTPTPLRNIVREWVSLSWVIRFSISPMRSSMAALRQCDSVASRSYRGAYGIPARPGPWGSRAPMNSSKRIQLYGQRRCFCRVQAAWEGICSIIIFFISLAVGSALCVATIQIYPSGSTTVPQRSPQNMSITGPFAVAPWLTALATTLSAFSTYRYKLAGEPPRLFALRMPMAGFSGPMNRLPIRAFHDAALSKAKGLLIKVCSCRYVRNRKGS